MQLLIDHNRLIAGHHFACHARDDLFARGGDKDVEHLGGANAINNANPRRLMPSLPRTFRKMLSGRYAGVKSRQWGLCKMPQHRPICSGCGEERGYTMFSDFLEKNWRGCTFKQEARCSHTKWKDD